MRPINFEVEILNSLNDLFSSEGLIAGGFARDVQLAKSPKDVDIFIHHTGDMFAVEDMLKMWCASKADPPLSNYYDGEQFWAMDYSVAKIGDESHAYSSITGIRAVYDMTICYFQKDMIAYDEDTQEASLLYEKPLQLVLTNKEVRKVIDDFPVSLSKAWFDGNKKFGCSEDFLRSTKTKTALYDIGVRPNYLTKIFNKFSDYAFIPENHELAGVIYGRKSDEINF